jgi:hypothetical protein
MLQRQSLSDTAGRQCNTNAYGHTLWKELDMRINTPAHRAKWIECKARPRLEMLEGAEPRCCLNEAVCATGHFTLLQLSERPW